MHFKEYFKEYFAMFNQLFPSWHVSPWLKVGAMVGTCLGLALVINAILFLVKPEWYGGETRRDNPKPIPHKGIGQKMKEGIALTKLEKAEVGYVQFLAMLGQFVGAILVLCGIAGATMALMPIVFNWSLTFATNFVANFNRAGLSSPPSFVNGMVYVFAGLAPTGFCLIGFAAAISLAGKILFLDANKSAVNFIDVDSVEENDDKQ